MMWIFLSILAGLGDATLYALMKKIKDMDGMLVVWAQYAFSIPFLVLALILFFPQNIDANVYVIGFLNAIILIVVMRLLFRAFQSSNLSLTVPLLSFTPLFLLVTSPLILGESPNSFIGYFGVLIIVIGAYVLNLQERKSDIFGPFRALFTNIGPRCALGAAFLMSIMANMFKIGINMSNPFFYSVLVHSIILVILLPLLLIKYKEKIFQIKNNLLICIGMGFANAFMSITAGLALLTAIVPYMISLKRSSVLFGMAYSHFWFKETNIKGRFLGTVIMFVGAAMIVLS